MNVTGTPNCYYPLTPPPDAKPDAAGYVKGKDLRDTHGYARLVDMLANHRTGSSEAAAQDRKEAQATVDEMKLKAGIVLIAPCHPGYTAADRTWPYAAGDAPTAYAPPTAASDAPATRQRRSLAQPGTDTGNNETREYISLEEYHGLSLWDKFVTVIKDIFSSAAKSPDPSSDSETDGGKPFNLNNYQNELDAMVLAGVKKYSDKNPGVERL